jgi:hypothetical protein
MGWSDPSHWPVRRAEAHANQRALRTAGYRGAIDADGHALAGPGTQPTVFAAGYGVRHDARRHEHLASEAWAWARLDGGFDGDGEADHLGEVDR